MNNIYNSDEGLNVESRQNDAEENNTEEGTINLENHRCLILVDVTIQAASWKTLQRTFPVYALFIQPEKKCFFVQMGTGKSFGAITPKKFHEK